MGLLKAGIGALGGVLADSWRDYFYCESLDADTLVVKGEKKAGGRSSNKKGTDNIISNGSIINVNDGQCMMIVESGKVADVIFVWFLILFFGILSTFHHLVNVYTCNSDRE